jgi:hypothetical protein
MFGTKMRSSIKDTDKAGVAAIVDQQFEYGARISAAGLVPIIEPEVRIDSPHKARSGNAAGRRTADPHRGTARGRDRHIEVDDSDTVGPVRGSRRRPTRP